MSDDSEKGGTQVKLAEVTFRFAVSQAVALLAERDQLDERKSMPPWFDPHTLLVEVQDGGATVRAIAIGHGITTDNRRTWYQGEVFSPDKPQLADAPYWVRDAVAEAVAR